MPNGATERSNLAAIERQIRETEENLAAYERLTEDGTLSTARDAQYIEGEKRLLEALYERRQAILASWMPKHDPSR
jgi:hypothetical protein